jgi:hypothetical protein
MRRSIRALTAAATSLGLAITCLLGNAPSASAEPECLTSSSDFDRDGTPDVAVGVPGGAGRNGAVQVRLSNEGKPITTTVTGAPGFGTAVTSLSSYTDEGDDALCSQLVVGSPDESLRTGMQRSGAVYVYTWSASAKRFVSRATIEAPGTEWEDGSQSGARFGAALAAEQRPADQIDPRPARLFVGAPGLDINDGRDTGQVTSFWVDADEDPDVHDVEFTRLGEPYTDEPTPGAALGSSLSVAAGKVAMGMPGFSTRDKAGAGAVLVDDVESDPDGPIALVLSQASRGVPGTAEKGDRFGTSVHLVPAPGGGAPTLLVGTPGEDVGSKTNAGSVTVARISADLELSGTTRTLDQNSAGMAGSVEAGDQLGAAVSSVRYGSSVALLVGAPGEDVGRVRDAGMVQTIGNGLSWTQQSSGVPGTAEKGDRLGASLAGSPSTGATKPLIGIPGEDSSDGAVLVGLPIGGGSVTYLKGTTGGDRFGFAVAP